MGTSGSSKGPGSSSPLVPTWMDDGVAAPLPLGTPPAAAPDQQPGGPDSEPGTQPVSAPAPRPPIVVVPAASGGRYRAARSAFSSFAGSGGSNVAALRRSLRGYVRSGAGNAKNATHRMGASRVTAQRVLDTFRSIERDGLAPTLARLNLRELADQPLTTIFIGLTDVVCKDGGSIDEGIARDAWLETIAEMEALDASSQLDASQMRDVFLSFIAHSIEGRLFQEVGAQGFVFAGDATTIAQFEEQLRSYIARSVQDSFAGSLSDVATFSDAQIRSVVDETYESAWTLLSSMKGPS